MLIGFLGIPASGKTTIAAKLFCNFKELEINTELIVEQARFYIMNKRKELPLGEQLTLNNQDQIKICTIQKEIEELASQYSPGSVVISDSSPLNALLYLDSDNFNIIINSNEFISNLTNMYDLLFYCHPIHRNALMEDPNRIHKLEEFNKLESRAKLIVNKIKSINNDKLHELLGIYKLDARVLEASGIILDKRVKIIQTSPN